MSSKVLILKRLVGLSLLLSMCGLMSAGCLTDPAPTVPSQTGAIAIESFTGTLPVGGTVFYSFTAPRSGNVTLTLLTLTVGGAPTDASITMGFGSPLGTGCSTSAQIGVTPGVTPQSTNPVNPGVYCVNLNDPGNLSADAAFAVNIARPK